jgi:transcriptional regulator with XRE-family HTH domain
VNKNLQALAEMLRNGRSGKGLTLREVEARAAISNAYLSQLEGEKIKQPAPQVLHKLCELYGCSYTAAMEFAGYPIPNAQKARAPARFLARLGKTTPDEESALLEYLQFLRSRKR